MKDPFIHLSVICRRIMTDIDQKKNGFEIAGSMQIILDHLSPFFFFCRCHTGISISRKIDQIQFIIDLIKIDRLCLARLCTGTRQCLPVHQTIDQ